MRALIHSFHDINSNAPTRFIYKLHTPYAFYITYFHVSTSQNIWLTQNKLSQVLQTLTTQMYRSIL